MGQFYFGDFAHFYIGANTSGREAVQAFERAGWLSVRRVSSHVILAKPGVPAILSVPDHRTLKRGTLRGLIRTAELTVEEFVDLLRD